MDARRPLRVRSSWSHFEGDRDVAGNATVIYVSSYHSFAAQVGATYEVLLGPLRLRPGGLAGISPLTPSSLTSVPRLPHASER